MATKKKVKAKKLVNNVIFVIDESSSMSRHANAVNRVVKSLADPLNQSGFKTRVSLYTFADRVNRKLYLTEDFAELNRFNLRPDGMTTLIDASVAAISDHKNDFLITKKDEDNTFLLYVITDGEENRSRYNSAQLRELIGSLDDSWTVATMVPNSSGVHYAKNCGFPAGNIEMWDTTSEKGFENVGQRVADTYTAYTTMRSAGVRSSTDLFSVNAANLNRQDVKAALVQDKDAKLFRVHKEEKIRDFVERHTGEHYKIGRAFYELVKKEKVQPQKEVAIVSQDGKRKYFGNAARQMLGLNIGDHIKVVPGDHGEWRIFIQSTSVNRKVVPGQSILLRD